MNNFKSIFFVLPVVVIALVGTVTLVACGRQTDGQTDSGKTVGQRLDSAIDKSNEKVANASAKVGAEMDKAGAAVSNAASSISASTSATAAKAGDIISDSAITASINADLLKDTELSIFKIDVDVKLGVVALNGLAPNEGARLRGGRIAASVKGVTEVKNNLVLKKI